MDEFSSFSSLITAILLTLLSLMWFRLRSRSSSLLPPGPIPWPIVGSLFSIRGPLHVHFAKLSHKYGPLIYTKLGMVPVLVVNNSEMAKQVLKVHDAVFANRPPSNFFKLFSLGYNNVFFVDQGDHWRKLRRIARNELFSAAKIQMASHLWESSLRDSVHSINGQTVHLQTVAGKCGCNLICTMLFGNTEAIQEKFNDFFDLILHAINLSANINLGDIFPAIDWLDVHGIYNECSHNVLPKLTALLSEIVEKRKLDKSMDKNNGVILDKLLMLHDKDSISDTSIKAFLLDMLAAGTNSSYTTADWAMAELLANPAILAKAQQEIDQVVGKGRLVKATDIHKLHYVQAIFTETLRVHTVTPFLIPHFNHTPVTVMGYKVPAGCRVLVNNWAISRDPERWVEPERFKPERFLGLNTERIGQSFDFLPFSAGRRMCPGYPLAMNTVPLILATLIHAFEWEIHGQISLEEEPRSFILKRSPEMTATAHPRLDKSAYFII